MSVSKFLGSKIGNALRTTGYDNFPELPVNSIEKDINKINIYPNPTSEKIFLDFGGEGVADLVIYDILGNKIKTIPNYKNKSEIDVSKLAKGTYILKYNSQSQKFIKE